MLLYSRGSETDTLSSRDIRQGLFTALNKLGQRKRVLVIPPDYTRFHSRAGIITRYIREFYKEKLIDILPALGTHRAMTESEITNMFGNIPVGLFREHRWREDVNALGVVPSDFIKKISEGKLDFELPAQVNKLLVHGGHDLILSVGQVVPHEITGMANYNKNIFIGTGGSEGINKSHFLGAVYGMERIIGRTDNPVRQVLNYASDHFSIGCPVIYILTVVGREKNGSLALKGLFIGDDIECFHKASELSIKVNVTIVKKPLKKIVVYLDPSEYRSTWLGNKSIYRTRMAVADSGELVILGPGIREFGEDPEIDRLIRKYGYSGTENILNMVKENDDLKENLSAAAHLIHGSSEGRFTVTYCPGSLLRREIEGVNFNYRDPAGAALKYNPHKLKEGYNTLPDGEEIYFISNPAAGLWALDKKFMA